MPEVPHHHGAGLHDAAPGQSQHAASHVSLQHLQSDANLRAAAAGGVDRGTADVWTKEAANGGGLFGKNIVSSF